MLAGTWRKRGRKTGSENVTVRRREGQRERAVPYVVSFFTSSSEKRSTFTSLWLDVRRASAAVGDGSTGDNVRSPSTRSTCQKSISSLRGRSLPRRFLIPWGTACLRPRCLLVEDRGLPFLPSLLQCFPVTSQLFLVESFHRLSV